MLNKLILMVALTIGFSFAQAEEKTESTSAAPAAEASADAKEMDHHGIHGKHGMHGMHGMMHGPCAKDIKALCGDVKPGHGAIMTCMHENMDKISAECKEHHVEMMKHMEEMQEMKVACEKESEGSCESCGCGKCKEHHGEGEHSCPHSKAKKMKKMKRAKAKKTETAA